MTDDNALQMARERIQLIQLFEIEDSECQLMGLTDHGDRLFFSITPNSLRNTWSLSLSFIRIRPPYLKYGMGHGLNHVFEPCIVPSSSPQQVRHCCAGNGVLFLNALKPNRSDCVLLIDRNDMECEESQLGTGSNPQLIESVETDSKAEDGNPIVALGQMPLSQCATTDSMLRLFSRREFLKFNAGRPFVGIKPLSIEAMLPQPIMLCLRQKSMVFYRMRRHSDVLRQLLRERNYARIQALLGRVGLVECQAMAILIAIGHDEADLDGRQLVRQEAMRFLKTAFSADVERVYRPFAQRLGCPNMQTLAVYLVLARLLRPIWSYSICVLDPDHNDKVSARYSAEELFLLMNPLNELRGLVAHLVPDGYRVKQLVAWISRCAEILHILIMCQRCQFSAIYESLPVEMQRITKDITFDQLMTEKQGSPGFDLLKTMISLMVPTLDLNEVKGLNRNCASYFTSAQLMMFLAKSEMKNRSKLESALDMFCEVCDDDSFDVQTVCHWLRTEKYYNGVAKLVFCVQNKLILRMAAIQREQQQLEQQVQMQQRQQQQPAHNLLERVREWEGDKHRLRNRITVAWGEVQKCLSALYLESNLDDPYVVQKRDKLLKQCLQETNKDFAFDLYGWFLRNQLIDTLFPLRPRYLEEYLMPTQPPDGAVPEVDHQRLEKLVHFYRDSGDTLKRVQLLEALSRTRGFSLEKRRDFLLEGKRACKLLDSNRSQLELDNGSAEIADKFVMFDEKHHICNIQIEVVAKLRLRQDTQEDMALVENKLLNLQDLYHICQQCGLNEEQLKLLSFCNDPKSEEHVKRLWQNILASMVLRFEDAWLEHVEEDLSGMANVFDLQQQRWMFDLCSILKELHHLGTTVVCRHPSPHTAIIDAIYPKIKGVTQQHMVMAYKYLLSGNRVQNTLEKLHIIRSARHLVQLIKCQPPSGDLSMSGHQSNNIRDPRLSISHISQSIISSTPSVDDLVAQCLQFLERQHIADDQDLMHFFKNLA